MKKLNIIEKNFQALYFLNNFVMKENISIPIFPLNGVIFFPETNLPLNIFEDRYLAMIDFALSHNKMIGMIQLKENLKPYKIGCVGKISSFNKTNDGRYIINLTGQNYFKISEEIFSKKQFREVKATIQNNQDILLKNQHINEKDKKILIENYLSYINQINQEINFDILKSIETPNLIKFIAMTCPFSIAEKQMLLETFNFNELVNKLNTLFYFYSSDQQNEKLIN